MRVEHCISPIYDERSQVLVLGTMPSPASREEGFFYGHPRNRFWPVLASLFDEPVPETNEQRTDLLLRHHIALWDVLASCDINGASDASIVNEQPNDLEPLLKAAPIERIFCTGATAERLYRKHLEGALNMTATRLPSTSPANAAFSFERLVAGYAALRTSIADWEPPALDVAQVVQLEQRIASDGTPLDELMNRAGRFLAYETAKLLRERGDLKTGITPDAKAGSTSAASGRVVILCGNGNNGGDGWVAARYLDRWGVPVAVVTARPPEDLTAQPARDAALETAARLSKRSRILCNPSDSELEQALSDASAAIDALLGTGFAHAEVRPPFGRWIELLDDAFSQELPVLSADVPSGLNAQTGEAARQTVRATKTITMIAPKTGVLAPGAKPFCGTVCVAPLAYIEPLFP